MFNWNIVSGLQAENLALSLLFAKLYTIERTANRKITLKLFTIFMSKVHDFEM